MQLGQQEAWLHCFFHLPPGRRRSCLIGVTNTLFRLIQEQLRPAPTWHLSGSEPRAKAILKCNRLNGHMFRSGTWCVRAHWKRALPVAPRPNSPPGLLLPEENKVKTWPPSASVADRWQMCDAVTTVHAAGVGGWGGRLCHGRSTNRRQSSSKHTQLGRMVVFLYWTCPTEADRRTAATCQSNNSSGFAPLLSRLSQIHGVIKGVVQK